MRWIQHYEVTRKFTISEITEVLAQRLANTGGLSSSLMALPFGRAATEYLGIFHRELSSDIENKSTVVDN